MLLSSGGGQSYGTPWHRDHCRLGCETETTILARDLDRQCFLLAPLLPDDRFLWLVPGSHARPAAEMEASTAD